MASVPALQTTPDSRSTAPCHTNTPRPSRAPLRATPAHPDAATHPRHKSHTFQNPPPAAAVPPVPTAPLSPESQTSHQPSADLSRLSLAHDVLFASSHCFTAWHRTSQRRWGPPQVL